MRVEAGVGGLLAPLGRPEEAHLVPVTLPNQHHRALVTVAQAAVVDGEVVAHRLEHEYGCKARIAPSRYQVARWVTCDEADGGARELQRFIDANAHRVAYDAVDAPTVLVEYAPELRAIESNWPKIKFHALREHAGLVFQRQIVA